MADEQENQEEKPKGGGGMSKIIILALLLCNVLSIGGLAAFVLLGGGSEERPATEEVAAAADKGKTETKKEGGDEAAEEKSADGEDAEAEEEEGASTSADLGPTVKLGSFVINLNDPGHPRYLKVTLKAEVSADSAKNEIRGRDPQVRDIVISYLSSLTIKETYGARAKATIRDNIQRRINHILTTGEVVRVFFTDFMTQ